MRTLDAYNFQPERVPTAVVATLQEKTTKENVRLIVNILNILGTLIAIQAFIGSDTFITIGDTDTKCEIMKMLMGYLLVVIRLIKWIISFKSLKPVYGTILATATAYNASLVRQTIMSPIKTAEVIFRSITMRNVRKLTDLIKLKSNGDVSSVFAALLLGGTSNYVGASGMIETYVNMTESTFMAINNTPIKTLKQIYSGTTYGLGMTGMRDIIDSNISMLVKLMMVFAVVNVYGSVKITTKVVRNKIASSSKRSMLRIGNLK